MLAGTEDIKKADIKAEACKQEDIKSTTDTKNGDETVRPIRKPKELKYAILLGYQGQNYFGMQLQRLEKEYPTVELHLLNAMIQHGFIQKEQKDDLFSWHFQRAARTDRAVSAVRQMCSALLRVDQSLIQNGVSLLNSSLPEDIRVFAVKRVTPSFHAQKFCDGRTYSYTLPTFSFAPCDQLTNDAYRITEERIAEVQELLNCFIGSHNFYNYTSRMEYTDPRMKRFIMDIKCERPFIFTDPIRERDVEFMSIYIHGQSFILHQIRKMIGIVITILRGFMYKSDIARSFQEQRLDIPRAPGLGLLLERLHYNRFEKFFEKTHGSLNDWGMQLEADILSFRDRMIMNRILSEECRTQSMMLWLSTLPVHRFIVDPEDEMGENISELRTAACNTIMDGGKINKQNEENVDEDEHSEQLENEMPNTDESQQEGFKIDDRQVDEEDKEAPMPKRARR